MKSISINQQEEHATGKSRLSIRQKLQRILQVDQPDPLVSSQTGVLNKSDMITKVTTRPNPFYTSITLDVTCAQSKHVIVRMFDGEDRILKMFSWFLVKGINVTAINDVKELLTGTYCLDIIDLDGDVLYTAKLVKEK